MDSEPETQTRTQLISDIKTLLDDLETELEAEVAAGRGKLADRIAEARSRLDELRGIEVEEPEPAQTTVDQLRGRVDELATELDQQLEEGRTRVLSIIDDIEGRLTELEARIRPK